MAEMNSVNLVGLEFPILKIINGAQLLDGLGFMKSNLSSLSISFSNNLTMLSTTSSM